MSASASAGIAMPSLHANVDFVIVRRRDKYEVRDSFASRPPTTCCRKKEGLSAFENRNNSTSPETARWRSRHSECHKTDLHTERELCQDRQPAIHRQTHVQRSRTIPFQAWKSKALRCLAGVHATIGQSKCESSSPFQLCLIPNCS